MCSTRGLGGVTNGLQGQVVYLDHAATTPMSAEAVAAMTPFLSGRFGNPSGGHALARAAQKALDDAREELANLLGAAPGDIVFTSGGTEADNLAVFGEAGGAGTVLCSAVEHPAVLNSCLAAGGHTVAVDHRGAIDLEALAEALDAEVRLVSVMLVNNETGVRQPLEEVVSLVHERAPDALVHTDAVQAFGWLDVAELTRGADLVSLSAHKFGGPQGVGALVVRPRASSLRPLLRGGPQEHERRAGTQNVAGIVAMAAAAKATARDRATASARVRELSTRLVEGIKKAVPHVYEAVAREHRVDAICNLGLEGVEAEELLAVLDELGVCVSAGAACASGAVEASHVLLAMGRTPEEARCHVRLSLGHVTTSADVDAALSAFPEAVARLRA
jgi:cysteine desulfurase